MQCQKCEMREGRGNSGIVALAILLINTERTINLLALPRKIALNKPSLNDYAQLLHTFANCGSSVRWHILDWQCRITLWEGGGITGSIESRTPNDAHPHIPGHILELSVRQPVRLAASLVRKTQRRDEWTFSLRLLSSTGH